MDVSNIFFVIVMADTVPFHKCKKHSSHRKQALTMFCNLYTRKSTYMHQQALFPSVGCRNADK